MAAIAGAAFPSSRLTQLESAIEAGHVLVLVDVSEQELREIEKLVTDRHPEVEVEVVEPHAPVIPRRP